MRTHAGGAEVLLLSSAFESVPVQYIRHEHLPAFGVEMRASLHYMVLFAH